MDLDTLLFISTCERPGPTPSYFQPVPSYSSGLAVSSARYVNTCDSFPVRHALSSENVYTNPADHTELKRERGTASVTYVFREIVRNEER
jgi:hypothetical protein